MILEYQMIPGFLAAIGGAITASVGKKARAWVMLLTSVLCILFILGLVPNGIEWPVPFVNLNHSSRLGALFVAIITGMLSFEMKLLSVADILVLGLMSGAFEFAALGTHITTTVFSTEIAALLAIAFIYNNDLKHATYVTAIPVMAITILTMYTSIMSSTAILLDPELIILGHKLNLSRVTLILLIVSIAIQCRIPPLSALIPRIYTHPWPSEPVKGFVFLTLTTGSFLHAAMLLPSAGKLMQFFGCVTIIYGAVTSLSERDKYRMIAQNAASYTGLAMLMIGLGFKASGFLYFMLSSMSHIVGLFFLQYQDSYKYRRLFVALMFPAVSIPLMPLPPALTFLPVTELFLSVKHNMILRTMIQLHVVSSFISMTFKFLSAKHKRADREIGSAHVLLFTLPIIIITFINIIPVRSITPYKNMLAIFAVNPEVLKNIAELLIGAITGFLLGNILFVRTRYCQWDIDLNIGYSVKYLVVLVHRFFHKICILVFDYAVRFVYTIGQFDVAMHLAGNTKIGTSGAVVLLISALVSLSLWTFLVIRHVL